ncbi:unnamed protein product [Euphydryas editha]|uniref:Reverse transcriptase domain-containing protein n=1 Tax=Euphydryas editha TaxID=104508 RepID=A0AAU9V8C2_EUPED|nr:unnamed protein product [Euphydryas editha]
MNKPFQLLYQNVRGLRTKTEQFRLNILQNDYEVLLVTETWLKSGFYMRELSDSRYDIFRADRSNKTSNKLDGGGVMICTKSILRAQERSDWSCTGVESVWITIPKSVIRKNQNLNIGVFYIPPDDYQVKRLETVTNFLSSILTSKSEEHFIITGDFNLPNIDWKSEGPLYLNRGSTLLRTVSSNFIETCSSFNLKQFNQIPNVSNNTLDLIFSNIYLNVQKSDQILVTEDKYHPCLEIDASDLLLKELSKPPLNKMKFKKADYSVINEILSKLNWQNILRGDSIDVIVDKFYETINKILNEHIPVVTERFSCHYPIWYNKSLIHIIQEKLKAHARWKSFKNPRDYDEFSLLRRRQKKLQHYYYEKFKTKMQNDIKKDPKFFWRYQKYLRNNNSGYPSSLSLGDRRFNSPKEICEGFSEFFESVFEKQNHNKDKTHVPISYADDTICNLNINKELVLKILKALDINKGAGTDRIPAIFYVKCANNLADPLSIIFDKSINEFGAFPTQWKDALIIPIHKAGARHKIEHYRPISILNTISKIFERLIYNAIAPAIHKSIPLEQHGFMLKRSTLTNLSVFTNFVHTAMDKQQQVDVIYTDFQKAFDRVDHVILLQKLQALGIKGDLHRWFCSYISKRQQAVVIGSARSDFVHATSGVPQGSLLGPLLYNAYLYDIYRCFKYSRFLLFADDKKIYKAINKISDCVELQHDLNNLSNFYKENKIIVNIKKTVSITFSRKVKNIEFVYYIDNNPIQKVNSVRDLGIQLDHKLLMTEHIEFITDKAYKQLGYIKRVCKTFTDVESIKMLYFSYVRSVLEYCCSIWSPNYSKYKNKLEAIQKHFLRFLCFVDFREYKNYTETCKHYKMETLEIRRRQCDMYMLYDILAGHIDCNDLVSALYFRVPNRRTRHTELFYTPKVHTNYARNSILSRIVNTYNEFYSEIDLFNMPKKTFKKKVKSKDAVN